MLRSAAKEEYHHWVTNEAEELKLKFRTEEAQVGHRLVKTENEFMAHETAQFANARSIIREEAAAEVAHIRESALTAASQVEAKASSAEFHEQLAGASAESMRLQFATTLSETWHANNLAATVAADERKELEKRLDGLRREAEILREREKVKARNEFSKELEAKDAEIRQQREQLHHLNLAAAEQKRLLEAAAEASKIEKLNNDQSKLKTR